MQRGGNVLNLCTREPVRPDHDGCILQDDSLSARTWEYRMGKEDVICIKEERLYNAAQSVASQTHRRQCHE